MAKTIPALQWTAGIVWAQKNHRGLEGSLTVMLHVGNAVAFAPTGSKPEFTPVLGVIMGVHGLTNVDCVTEWFLPRNSKMTLSPAAAVTLDGENARAPPSPTRT